MPMEIESLVQNLDSQERKYQNCRTVCVYLVHEAIPRYKRLAISYTLGMIYFLLNILYIVS